MLSAGPAGNYGCLKEVTESKAAGDEDNVADRVLCSAH